VSRALVEAHERAVSAAMARALEEAHRQLESIIATVQDVLWSCTIDRRILLITPSVEEIYGFKVDEVLKNPNFALDIIHPDDVEHVKRAWSELIKGGDYDIEYRITRKTDGAERWIHTRARLVRTEGAEPRINGSARDITDRMIERQRLARLSRVREITSGINSALVRIRDREPLFDEICRIAVEVGGLTRVRIWMLDEAGTYLKVAAGRELPGDELYPVPDILRLGAGERPQTVERAWRNVEPEIVNDVQTELRGEFGDKVLRTITRSVGCFPLVVEDRAVGVIAWQSREVNYFDDEEVRLLQELTSNISFAIELMVKREQINYLAYYDPITALPNRTLFIDRLQQAIEAAKRSGGVVALTLMDIEQFKAINDAIGQHRGDRLLAQLGERLKAAFNVNHIAHIWADVFGFFTTSIREESSVVRMVADEVKRVVAQPFDIDEHQIRIVERAGIAVFPTDAASAQELFRNAESALKKAKAGREHIAYYAPEFSARVAQRLDLEGRLRRAVEQREFVLYYQPKVDVATRRIVGAEALIRWRDPEHGLVMPGQFIAVLEETRMILDVGRWAIEEALATHRSWRERDLPAPRIAVNVAAVQLHQNDFVAMVRAALGDDHGDDCGIDLEFTESHIIENVAEGVRKLTEVRALGVQLSLDDFGTGYSSLSYLSRLPVDSLKIDRSFVNGMVNSKADTSIVSAVISLAQSMRLKVIAEGVETEEQARLLQLLRCDQMQGFLISPAVPREQFEQLLLKG
jgi:diguanylate cyclase (GGDEF)-like protein/PAS domain S-box-containing protein